MPLWKELCPGFSRNPVRRAGLSRSPVRVGGLSPREDEVLTILLPHERHARAQHRKVGGLAGPGDVPDKFCAQGGDGDSGPVEFDAIDQRRRRSGCRRLTDSS